MAFSASRIDKGSRTSLDEQSLKVAIAISLLRSKALQKPHVLSSHSSESDSLKWKRKAKERKQELLRLREDLKDAEDATNCDLFTQSQNTSCKCYFFDNLGKSSPARLEDISDNRFSDVLRRRFLRQVRLKDRRRTKNSTVHKRLSDLTKEGELEHMRASVDFLVELCETVSPLKANFSNWSHQAVDFILASMKSLLLMETNMELLEGIVNSLVMRLIRRMCSSFKVDGSDLSNSETQFYVQHLIRKLASDAYIGQPAILLISQRVSVAAESLLFLDPFDPTFPAIHQTMFIMIQLIEFLVSDYLLKWANDKCFNELLFEEWLASVLHAKKAAALLESRSGLYLLYVDRVIGKIAKQVGQLSKLQKLGTGILDDLLLH